MSMPNFMGVRCVACSTLVVIVVSLEAKSCLVLSCLGRKLLAQETLLPSRFNLTAAGKHPLQADGEAHIQFSIEGHPMEADVSVSSQLDELLLGGDWLAKQEGCWDFKSGTLHLEGLEIRLYPNHVDFGCRRVVATEACLVPPRHQMNIPVRLEGEKVHQSSIDWALESRPVKDGVFVARTLFGNENNVKVARVLNNTETPYRLGEGDFVGDASPVSVAPAPEVSSSSKGRHLAMPQSKRAWRMPFPNISFQRRQAMVARNEAEDSCAHVQCLLDGLPKDLTDEQQRLARDFICSRASSFSKADFDIGRTDIIKHRIDTGDNAPHFERLRRHPTSQLEVIDCLLYTSPSPRD